MQSNNFNYRNREWLFNEMIAAGKSEHTVAQENGWTVRVVQKWAQIYGFGDNKFKELKTLSVYQKQLILGSLLGDGHITDEGVFIVSHSEKQKDYLFWEHQILGDCCKNSPTRYEGKIKEIKNQLCNIQPSYRFNTRKINELKILRKQSKVDIIHNITDLELSIWMLDDGYRDIYNWDLCIASLSLEEKVELFKVLQDKNLKYAVRKDPRYIRFNCRSTRELDAVILENIPNELDIIQYKILKRKVGGAQNG